MHRRVGKAENAEPGEARAQIDLHLDGYLFLLSDARHVETFRAAVDMQRALGVAVDWLTPEEARTVAPGIGIEGSCRVCIVKVDKMPKLQTSCSTVATEGMVVWTSGEDVIAARSGVFELLLVNHPLDCPVCDKGGECPLQDLTFRYGPGTSRMTLPKRTYEKPLPISSSIVLDRERCILCYRCTRFSSDVAEDGELVARERGSASVIATFEERPYGSAFSGNVTELCPVGALLPTAYRFKARPWEIVNVPTVCTGCATGCNTWSTLREGKVDIQVQLSLSKHADLPNLPLVMDLAKTEEQIATMRAEGSIGSRLALYADTWHMARDRPWFGWGMAGARSCSRFASRSHSDWGLSAFSRSFLA